MSKLLNKKRIVRDFPRTWDVNDLLDRVQYHGDKVLYKYFVGKDVLEMTYAEFYQYVKKISAAIVAKDLSGKKIAVIGETSPEWLATYVACLASGAVVVPMDKVTQSDSTIIRFEPEQDFVINYVELMNGKVK